MKELSERLCNGGSTDGPTLLTWVPLPVGWITLVRASQPINMAEQTVVVVVHSPHVAAVKE